ncbi:MAG: phosphoglycerate kinase [Candidatus Pacebacteria bacterium]|nr:phosphoglycerate kinase [Candidatus Paceibacterota bacterium]
MNNLRNVNLKGKRVLVRCDFNVPLDSKGNITDDFRIRKTIPTIEYLRNSGARIILLSHLGQPNGRDLRFSLRPTARKLWELIQGKVSFLSETIGGSIEKQIKAMEDGEIVVLENIRFHKGEESNNDNFARALSKLADIFVQDGFGVCHREHTSTVGIPKYLPSYPGFLLEEEIRILSDVLITPDRPLVSIIGGVKISSKIRVIERLLDKSDHVLLGGKIANSLLVAKGICVRDSLTEDEEDLMEVVKKIDLTSPKIHLPIDGVMSLLNSDEEYHRVGAVGTLRKEEGIFDIGPETIDKYKAIIGEAKTVIWNGPLGYFEKEGFNKGTLEIARIISHGNNFSVVGGGETVDAIHKLGIESKFEHISTGGGAMLDFLAGKDLPGIMALEDNSKKKENNEN